MMHKREAQIHHLPKHRSINWFDHTCQVLNARFPEIQAANSLLVARLSALLLERLSKPLAKSILNLLPDNFTSEHFDLLKSSVENHKTTPITYSQCLDRTSTLLITLKNDAIIRQSSPQQSTNESSIDTETLELSQRLTNTYLWFVAEEFPADIKARIQDQLPAELKYRMNLCLSQAEDAKVA